MGKMHDTFTQINLFSEFQYTCILICKNIFYSSYQNTSINLDINSKMIFNYTADQ